MDSQTQKLQTQEAVSQVTIDYWHDFFVRFCEMCDRVFVFIGLRRKRPFWGVIYDSVNKQPLDPVIVKMAYVESGRVVETCVTDLEGRYGFLARPGRFKIFAQKTNYKFPSELVQGEHDGIYQDLYHGEFFDLSDDTEVIAPNIPMDPMNKDWNQQAKESVIKVNPYREYLIQTLVSVFFWFGLAYTTVRAFHVLEWWMYVVWVIYMALFILAVAVPEAKLWGMVVNDRGEPMPNMLLELVIPSLNNMVLVKAKTIENGKYFLRVNSGHYTLVVKSLVNDVPVKTFGSIPVVVHEKKILNKIIVVR